MLNTARIVLFIILRYEWMISCKAVVLLGKLRDCGLLIPVSVINIVGCVLGTRWAFRSMRMLGWEPVFPRERGAA